MYLDIQRFTSKDALPMYIIIIITGTDNASQNNLLVETVYPWQHIPFTLFVHSENPTIRVMSGTLLSDPIVCTSNTQCFCITQDTKSLVISLRKYGLRCYEPCSKQAAVSALECFVEYYYETALDREWLRQFSFSVSDLVGCMYLKPLSSKVRNVLTLLLCNEYDYDPLLFLEVAYKYISEIGTLVFRPGVMDNLVLFFRAVLSAPVLHWQTQLTQHTFKNHVDIKHQLECAHELLYISYKIKEETTIRSANTLLVNLLSRWLNQDNNALLKHTVPCFFYPHMQMTNIIADKCIAFNSAQRPIRLTFQAINKNTHTLITYYLLFKSGDALSVDMHVMQVFRNSELLLRQSGVDIPVTLYKIAPIEIHKNYGFIEYIPSMSIYEIDKQYKYSIIEYLCNEAFPNKKNVSYSTTPGTYIEHPGGVILGIPEHVFTVFAKTLAFYTIMCLLLGIKDRHPNNILITKKGCLFHIDFSYMYNTSTVFFDTKLRFPQSVIKVLNGTHSKEFLLFKSYAITIYMCLYEKKEELRILDPWTNNAFLVPTSRWISDLIDEGVASYNTVVLDTMHSINQSISSIESYKT